LSRVSTHPPVHCVLSLLHSQSAAFSGLRSQPAASSVLRSQSAASYILCSPTVHINHKWRRGRYLVTSGLTFCLLPRSRKLQVMVHRHLSVGCAISGGFCPVPPKLVPAVSESVLSLIAMIPSVGSMSTRSIPAPVHQSSQSIILSPLSFLCPCRIHLPPAAEADHPESSHSTSPPTSGLGCWRYCRYILYFCVKSTTRSAMQYISGKVVSLRFSWSRPGEDGEVVNDNRVV